MSNVYISCFGGLYRATKKQYAAYLRDVANGLDVDIGAYAKFIDGNIRDVTDISAEEARERLVWTIY